MEQFTHIVAGETVVINRVQTEGDLDLFRSFIRKNVKILACDTETTGLDMYGADFRVRLVQFGTPTESFVLPVELGGQIEAHAKMALLGVKKLVFQNGVFDLQVIDRHLGIPMERMWDRVLDTKILAHLVDPRGKEEGGSGHGLEDLTRRYVDAEVADNVKTLMVKIAREYKTTKNKIWSIVDLDHEEYNLYAGMDTILAARLSRILMPMVPATSRSLIEFEHKLAEICSYMERNGFLLDVEYAQELSAKLKAEEDKWVAEAKEVFGVETVNSTDQVADALEATGVRIVGRTPSGKRKVDKALLEQLQNGDNKEAAHLAHAVVEAKKARKWRTTWVDGFLSNRDADNRCHAHIQSLRARTARMSITGIPAQTLPSSDWMIRRCFVADPGHTIIACDYQTQELRVLSALAGDEVMQQAFKEGADLHQMTADAAGVSRKVGKTTNFAKVYGSGPKNIAEQCGIDLATAKKVVSAFEKTYPKVAQLGRRLQKESGKNGFVTTPSGRRLPVDPDRGYAALNYMVQSSSRDVTARALVRLHEAGWTPYLRLVIHDEVLLSVPEDKAEWAAKKVAEIIAEDFQGVRIGSDHEVGKQSWGSLYGSDY